MSETLRWLRNQAENDTNEPMPTEIEESLGEVPYKVEGNDPESGTVLLSEKRVREILSESHTELCELVVDIYMSIHVSELHKYPRSVQQAWMKGQKLYCGE